MKFKYLLAALAISTGAQAQTAPVLTCASFMQPGTYTGRLTNAINRDTWDNTTFLFVTTNGSSGCVQININNPSRSTLVRDAFILNALTTISVVGAHFISGIAYSVP